MKTNRTSVSMRSIDAYIDTKIVLPTEKNVPSKDMVEWGERNSYPRYLLDLYDNVPTLHSIINGNVDFISGDEVTILPLQRFADGVMNKRGDTIREQVRDIARDYELYGGYALQIIRNLAGEVAEIYYIDMRHLRTNKECNVFYYSEDWDKGGRRECVVYPAFMASLDWATMDERARASHASSILYVKNVHTKTYPAPVYAASVKSCEIERAIDDYHLNAINNSFTPSALVNFNNGVPDEQMMEQIEDDFTEKFSGHENGGRIVFSWNANKESATTIDYPKVEDFGERYDALSKHSRQQIFTAFHANPNLFGIPTENLGFSSEEYDSAFKLYNRTQIQPVQRQIADTYDKIYGRHGVLTIKPFSLEGNTEDNVD